MNPELIPYDTEEIQRHRILGAEVKVRITFHHKPDPPFGLTCVTNIQHVELIGLRYDFHGSEFGGVPEDLTRAELGAIMHYIKHTAAPQD